MTMSGNYWKWPDRDDIFDYLIGDVIRKIEVPTLINSRGIYNVPEINDIREENNNNDNMNIK